MRRLQPSRSSTLSLFVSLALVALVLAATAGVGTSGAGAATASIRLSTTAGAPGSTLQVSGTGFPTRASGTVVFGTTTAASFKTSRTGTFQTSFPVPSGYLGGVSVAGVVGSLRATAAFTVVEAVTTSTTSTTTSTSTSTTTSTSAPASTTTSTTSTTVPTSSTSRPFAATSAWNTLIPRTPLLDPNSSAQVAWLSGAVTGTTNPAVANLYNYGVPIWEADASTPKYSVNCVKTWGTCGLELEPVPVPAEAFATPVEKDGAMVVVDHSTNRSYEFYEGQKVEGGWQAGWGGVLSTVGDGVGTPANSATGSAVSRLAGVIRISEIKAGVIDHALVFSTDNACTSTYRYPAAKTDGRSTRTDCIPEGARIQLDPTIDVEALPMTAGERMVARALQKYGAYAIDNGGAKMAFIFEVPSGEADPYASVGFTRDYFAMNAIPWKSLRVLRSWTGS